MQTPGPRRPLILVADDDPDARRVAVLSLEGLGRILEAADGDEALRLIREEAPDLAVLDLSMPGTSGLELLELSRSLARPPAFLMLTAERGLPAAKRALELGAAAFLTKPFEPARLKGEARRLLAPEGPPDERPWKVKEQP